MDIVFKGRHTDVLERFRKHATVKLAKVAKLDHKAIRVDVEVAAEHNPRQSGRRERVELTITTRGPAIRAEAASIGSTVASAPSAKENVEKQLDQNSLKDVKVAEDRDKGVLTLKGEVKSEEAKAQAEEIAKANAGGMVVANEISVRGQRGRQGPSA